MSNCLYGRRCLFCFCLDQYVVQQQLNLQINCFFLYHHQYSDYTRIMDPRVTLVRIQKETKKLEQEPIDGVLVAREGQFKFHFCFYKLQQQFQNGFYHGLLQLPENYPFAPPKLMFFTPNGRFQPHKYICTSFTNYHKETWSPTWTIKNLLIATISFMYSNERGIGYVESSAAQKKTLASRSLSTNFKNELFIKLFNKKLIEVKALPDNRIKKLYEKFQKTQQKERQKNKLLQEQYQSLFNYLISDKSSSQEESNKKEVESDEKKNVQSDEQKEINLLEILKKKRKTQFQDQNLPKNIDN